MWNTSAPPGKIPYVPKWTLSCTLHPIIMIDREVFPGSRLSEFTPELKGFDDFRMTILYDNTALFDRNFSSSDPILVTHQLLDDKENTDHTLSIELAGKTDDHSCFYQGKSVSLGVKIELCIEELRLALVIASGGLKNYMGENEVQILQIKTPIYRWLLSNQDYIMKDLQSLYTP